jgi:hypothetical protein
MIFGQYQIMDERIFERDDFYLRLGVRSAMI